MPSSVAGREDPAKLTMATEEDQTHGGHGGVGGALSAPFPGEALAHPEEPPDAGRHGVWREAGPGRGLLMLFRNVFFSSSVRSLMGQVC